MRRAFPRVARGGDGTPPEALRADIELTCQAMSQKMRAGKYRFTQYRENLQLKGADRNPRVISIPTARDRIALRAMTEFLMELYPYAAGIIPQVKVRELAEAIGAGRFDTYVRLDIRDFYPSISHELVRKAIRRRVGEPVIEALFIDAIQTPTVPDRMKRRPPNNLGVPQGLSISNVLAELVVSPIDRTFEEDDRCDYYRFVDDVAILCSGEDASGIAAEATSAFSGRGLQLHEMKDSSSKSSIGPLKSSFGYLGYVFDGDKISVRPSSILGVESALARAFTRHKAATKRGSWSKSEIAQCQWYVNLVVTGAVHNGAAWGWLHYFRQMNDLVLLKKLDATVQGFARRFGAPRSFAPKTFMRAYWSIQHPDGRHRGYVPDFDSFGPREMREHLVAIFEESDVEKMSDAEVGRKFGQHISRAVRTLERDIGAIS